MFLIEKMSGIFYKINCIMMIVEKYHFQWRNHNIFMNSLLRTKMKVIKFRKKF